MTIEAATSNRSKCKACKKPIALGEMRFGDEVAGNFDGMMTFWYHLTCATARRPEQLRAYLKRHKKQFPERAAIEASLDGAVSDARTSRLLKVDRAPTGRAKCQQCKVLIEKSTLRTAIRLDEDDFFNATGYLHLACASTWAAADVDAHLTNKANKADKAEVTNILKAFSLLDTSARGKALEQGVRAAKKKAPETSVLADWLEEQGCALVAVELGQLLEARAKRKSP
jgi:hypothetical protein